MATRLILMRHWCVTIVTSVAATHVCMIMESGSAAIAISSAAAIVYRNMRLHRIGAIVNATAVSGYVSNA